MACFLSLDVLRAKFGDELPFEGGLKDGFLVGGRRVPFLNRQKGIHRAAVQRGRAALSIQTSWKSPYADRATDAGFVYSYRAGDTNQADNRALREAYASQVPLVYFVGTGPGLYQVHYPSYITDDDQAVREVVVTVGVMAGPMEEPEPVLPSDPIAREYTMREVRVRLHQRRFRNHVLPAYRYQCSVCRLQERRLLDAAHIAADAAPEGAPQISNGLSLCSIHHRAFDQNLVGVSPDYRVHISEHLLEDEDGPMLEVLKVADGSEIVVPRKKEWRPDPQLLAKRFASFSAA
jgi:putative restriction endonuclease